MLPIWEFLFSLKKVKSIVLFVLYDRVSRVEGLWTGGFISYCYDIKEKRLVINDKEIFNS